MDNNIKHGRCLCGSVQYTLSGPIIGVNYCHCKECRQSSGSAFGTSAAVAVSNFSLSATSKTPTYFESSPGKRRYFCGQCGSPIYSHQQDADTLYIRLGTLTDSPQQLPEVHIYVSDKATWHEITDALPQRQREEDLNF